MVCGEPERGNQRLGNFGRKMESVDDDDRENLLDVVHESCEHAEENSCDEEERRVNLDLADQSSRSLVFPNHVEIRLEAAECEDECDEKTAGTDKPKLSDGDSLCIFDDVHDLLGWPIQIEHVNDDGEVVRDEVSESDLKRNGREHYQKRNDCHEGRVGQCCRTGHSMVV